MLFIYFDLFNSNLQNEHLCFCYMKVAISSLQRLIFKFAHFPSLHIGIHTKSSIKKIPQECKLVQLLWRTVWRFIKKLEIELPYDPAIPLLGIHTEKTSILVL